MKCYTKLDLMLSRKVQEERIKCQVLKEASILKLPLKDDITFFIYFVLLYWMYTAGKCCE